MHNHYQQQVIFPLPCMVGVVAAAAAASRIFGRHILLAAFCTSAGMHVYIYIYRAQAT